MASIRILLSMCLIFLASLKVSALDSLMVKLGAQGFKFTEHIVQPKETIYKLSRDYDVDVNKLFKSNPGTKTVPLSIGQKVIIPLVNENFFEDKVPNSTKAYFKVMPGMTLFSISNKYFKIPVAKLKKINGLTSDVINPGEVLQIGWYGADISVTATAESEAVNSALATKQTVEVQDASIIGYKEKFTNQSVDSTTVLIHDNGAAYWNRAEQTGSVFVLHNTAKLGSIMKIENTLTGKVVYAKVLDRIPVDVYRGESLVISSKGARLLGAIDKRFFVEIDYVK